MLISKHSLQKFYSRTEYQKISSKYSEKIDSGEIELDKMMSSITDTIPGIQNISMTVNDGKYSFLGEVKFIGTTSLKSGGLINYERNSDIISIKLDTLLVGSLSVKRVILKTANLKKYFFEA